MLYGKEMLLFVFVHFLLWREAVFFEAEDWDVQVKKKNHSLLSRAYLTFTLFYLPTMWTRASHHFVMCNRIALVSIRLKREHSWKPFPRLEVSQLAWALHVVINVLSLFVISSLHSCVYACTRASARTCMWVTCRATERKRVFHQVWLEYWTASSGGLHAPAPTPSASMPGCQLFTDARKSELGLSCFMVGWADWADWPPFPASVVPD